MNSTLSNIVDHSTIGCISNGSENTTHGPCGEDGGDATAEQIRNVLSYLIAILIAIVMVGIGCAVELEKVVKHLKNPTGIITGLFCQFVVMPIQAYIWAKIFAMDDPETLSLLIVGSCPGGTLSNIVAYWIGGDMELSTVMTSVSVTVSLGMLPLLLFIYAKIFDTHTISVPFSTIGITIALIIVPISIGALLRYKFPKIALKILKIFSIAGVISLIIVAAVSIYLFHEHWSFQLGQIITSIFFPVCGMIFGYVISLVVSHIAKPLRLTHRQMRTVSVETGIQNGQLAMTLVQLSGWSIEVTGRAIVLPMLYTLAQVFWSLIMIGLYHSIYYAQKGHCPVLTKTTDEVLPDQEKTEVPKTFSENPAFEIKE